MKYLSHFFVIFSVVVTSVQSAEKSFDVHDFLFKPISYQACGGLAFGAFLCGTGTTFGLHMLRQKQERARAKAELCKLLEPYAWASLHTIIIRQEKLTQAQLESAIKSDRKITQHLAKNNYSESEFNIVFDDIKRVFGEKYFEKSYTISFREDDKPLWVELSNLWHKHKRGASSSPLQTEFNNLTIEAALPELLVPTAKDMLDEQGKQSKSSNDEIADSERKGHQCDEYHKEWIKKGLNNLNFTPEICDSYVNTIYDAYKQKKPDNIWKRAQEIAKGENIHLSETSKKAQGKIIKILEILHYEPKLEKRNPNEEFADRTILPWYIYYPLYPFLSEKVAKKANIQEPEDKSYAYPDSDKHESLSRFKEVEDDIKGCLTAEIKKKLEDKKSGYSDLHAAYDAYCFALLSFRHKKTKYNDAKVNIDTFNNFLSAKQSGSWDLWEKLLPNEYYNVSSCGLTSPADGEKAKLTYMKVYNAYEALILAAHEFYKKAAEVAGQSSVGSNEKGGYALCDALSAMEPLARGSYKATFDYIFKVITDVHKIADTETYHIFNGQTMKAALNPGTLELTFFDTGSSF